MNKSQQTLLDSLRRCGGYYECPKDSKDRRLGPLVGFAGKYEDKDGQMKQWVGDVYYNFAKAEERPSVIGKFALLVAEQVERRLTFLPDYVLGAPMGGVIFGFVLAENLLGPIGYIFAEKKIIALATATQREQSKLVLDRHEVKPESRVIIAEDVCNNFSTTQELQELLARNGSSVVGIACELNRSESTSWNGIPVVSTLHIPTKQYKQEDPEVAEDIARGNVVWKPKDEWPKLAEAM